MDRQPAGAALTSRSPATIEAQAGCLFPCLDAMWAMRAGSGLAGGLLPASNSAMDLSPRPMGRGKRTCSSTPSSLRTARAPRSFQPLNQVLDQHVRRRGPGRDAHARTPFQPLFLDLVRVVDHARGVPRRSASSRRRLLFELVGLPTTSTRSTWGAPAPSPRPGGSGWRSRCPASGLNGCREALAHRGGDLGRVVHRQGGLGDHRQHVGVLTCSPGHVGDVLHQADAAADLAHGAFHFRDGLCGPP